MFRMIQILLQNIKKHIGSTSDYSVLGNENTLFGYAKGGYQDVHMPGLCYPDLADGVELATGDGKWVLGASTVVIPENTMTTPFDLHFIHIEAVSDTAIYQINLYAGESETPIAKARTVKSSTPSGLNSITIQIPPQPIGTKITAKMASNKAGVATAVISLFYHVYTLA